MITRKLLFTSLFVVLFGLSTSSNAGFFEDFWGFIESIDGVVIDDKSRRLPDHESVKSVRNLGHTIERHIDKSNIFLANRCKFGENEGPDHATTYFGGIKTASENIRDVIKRNQIDINRKVNQSNQSEVFLVASGDNKGGFDGFGVNCRLYSNSFFYNILGNEFYFGPQGFDYERNKIVIKRKTSVEGKWFLLTSYPTPSL